MGRLCGFGGPLTDYNIFGSIFGAPCLWRLPLDMRFIVQDLGSGFAEADFSNTSIGKV